ncbi:MAG: aminomethyl-transferring glycine dehydrogenase subunit GcvPA [Candidatus Zixiibacteriota bacterium]|nr:MAG: aminomethyl-transferring glycine dehydrogenase subunit GcvPA [candidate division Zixibacteria bacterium]
MRYVSNTENDRRIMLDRIGVNSFDDLIRGIPDNLRLDRPLDIEPLSEGELLAELERIAGRNELGLTCFAGGGVYDHFIPAAVGALANRPEFVTAYTPYQAEVAQGTLQVIYEFQTHICRLTGMEVANASMYDGATAAAEAMAVACSVTRRNKIVVTDTVSPLYREVIRTFVGARGIELIEIRSKDGLVDPDHLTVSVDEHTACVLMAQPNFFGLLEEADQIAEVVRRNGAKLVMAVDPICQALLKTPADYGADIVVGEGQPLGIPLSFGGPTLGFFAARKALIRKLPGRIAARTQDVEGKTGFVLALQTREQHIRREKATSNICTNQALCATTAAIYLSLMGKAGLKQVALLSTERAQLAAQKIKELDGYSFYFDRPFVREFAVKTPYAARDMISSLVARHRLLAGIDAGRWYAGMEDCLIVAFTEARTVKEIDALVAGLRECATHGVLSKM